MDYIARGTILKGAVLGLSAVTTGMVDEARRRHTTYPTASAALGRVLTAASLMGMLLKENQRVSIQIIGDGSVKEVYAESDGAGNCRGYIQRPHIHLPLRNGKLDVGRAIGKGILGVVKDLGLKESYKGMVNLVTGEIGDDLAYYFTTSEQQPSAVGLGVYVGRDNTVKAAGGFLVQPLPDVDESIIGIIEENIKITPPVSALLLEGKTPEDILSLIFQGFTVELHEKRPVRFSCRCSRERGREVLILLGIEELKGILKEGKDVELTCKFCNESYIFTPPQIQEVLDEMIGVLQVATY